MDQKDNNGEMVKIFAEHMPLAMEQWGKKLSTVMHCDICIYFVRMRQLFYFGCDLYIMISLFKSTMLGEHYLRAEI